MKNLNRYALWMCASTVLLSGCVSVVHVQKAPSQTAGIHYYLPQVFIKVTPSADGSITVEKLYVPDPSKEYVISADSYLGSYTIDVNRSESGLLETVSFNSDSTGIAKQLLASQAAVRSADIDAKAAKVKTDAADAKTAAEKAKTALEATDKARKDAKVTLDFATGKFQLLDTLAKEPGATADLKGQVLTARLAVIEAQTKYDAADLAYNTLASNVAAANGLSSANASRPKAPAPVFYRVDMRVDTVVLKEAFPQEDLETFSVPEASSVADPLLVLPDIQPVRPAEKTKALTATVKANQLLLRVKPLRLALKNANGPTMTLPLLSLQNDRVTVVVELPPDLPSGDYDLDAEFVIGKAAAPTPKTVALQFRVIK